MDKYNTYDKSESKKQRIDLHKNFRSRKEVLDSVNLLDERRGILHVRRHLAASPLFKGIPNFKETRIAMLRAETVKELFSILDYIRGNYGMNS